MRSVNCVPQWWAVRAYPLDHRDTPVPNTIYYSYYVYAHRDHFPRVTALDVCRVFVLLPECLLPLSSPLYHAPIMKLLQEHLLHSFSSFIMPIDINLLRAFKGGVPQLVKLSQTKRFARVELVDEVIGLDEVQHTCNSWCIAMEENGGVCRQDEQGEAFTVEGGVPFHTSIMVRLVRSERADWTRVWKRNRWRSWVSAFFKCRTV